MAAPVLLSPDGALVASCLSGRLFNINKWIWPRVLSNDYFCPGSWTLWDFVCSLWGWISVSHDHLALLNISPADLQSQTFLGFIFIVQDPWAGELWTPHCVGRINAIVIILPFGGPPPVIMGLEYTLTRSFWPFSLWFLLFFNLVFFQLEYNCITMLS